MSYEFKGQDFIETDALETFDLDSPFQLITTRAPEFIAISPFDNLPVIAAVELIYRPTRGKCIELSSFDRYLRSFYDVGISQEEAARRIRADVGRLLECDVLVRVEYDHRSGIGVVIEDGAVGDGGGARAASRECNPSLREENEAG